MNAYVKISRVGEKRREGQKKKEKKKWNERGNKTGVNIPVYTRGKFSSCSVEIAF